ncbi:MAG TPA: tetratricopeptide repeat protein [Usitatibacter sp.]|jgi:predicted negative regulator of RcsB-dependent stress response|nr:tetratricopeptide repeat protein [Usitatibacter sp.]
MTGSYDFEEQERIAELKAWWEDNRWYVIGAIVAAVLVFAGYRGWTWWSARADMDAAAMFRPVSEAMKSGDPKKITQAADPLIDKHPRSYFASEAALAIAKADFEKGELGDAQKRLAWVMDHGAETHRGIARLRLAAVLLDQKKYDQALKTLDENKDEAFAAPAADLRGDIMLAQGRLDEARAAYKAAMEKAGPGNPVRSVAGTKLNALGGAE